MAEKTEGKKKTDLKGQHSFMLLCLYVADPATSRASKSLLGTLLSSVKGWFIQ